MQQSQQFGDEDNEGAGAAQMEAMTRLTDRAQMANFLTYGKWNLDDELIEKLKKDEERKERVSRSKSRLWLGRCKMQEIVTRVFLEVGWNSGSSGGKVKERLANRV